MPWHPPCALLRLILPVHSRLSLPKTIENDNQPKIVCFVLPCAVFKVHLKALSILQNDTEIIISYPVKSRRQLRWLTIVSGISAALAGLSGSFHGFPCFDLGYDPLSQIISP